MAEIKLSNDFTNEVQAFRTSGEQLSSAPIPIASAGELSLPTIDAYQERLVRIKSIISQFSQLTNKDAKDMDALATRLRTADAT